jgi:hypothetical protein
MNIGRTKRAFRVSRTNSIPIVFCPFGRAISPRSRRQPVKVFGMHFFPFSAILVAVGLSTQKSGAKWSANFRLDQVQLPSSRTLSRTSSMWRKRSFVARVPSVGFHPLGSRGRCWRPARPGQTFPFIKRLTQAYLNFETADAAKARGLWRGIMAKLPQAI